MKIRTKKHKEKKSLRTQFVRGSLICALTLLILGLGAFPNFSSAAQSIGGVTLLEVVPRIMTPNGDSLNDVVFLKFDTSLAGLPIESSVFDINGAKIAGLNLDSNNQRALTWNGRDDSGNAVPAGIYIYSIKIGKNIATGTVVVAK